jgi:two-component system response regulator
MNPDDVEVLLVEDNPEDAELTLRVLKQRSISKHIELVTDGVQALDRILAAGEPRDGAPAVKLILLDLKLPKVDGLEVLRRIKSDESTRAIPVIVWTSSQEPRDIAESYRLGANSYVVKPVGYEEFVRALTEIGRYWLVRNQPSEQAEGR